MGNQYAGVVSIVAALAERRCELRSSHGGPGQKDCGKCTPCQARDEMERLNTQLAATARHEDVGVIHDHREPCRDGQVRRIEVSMGKDSGGRPLVLVFELTQGDVGTSLQIWDRRGVHECPQESGFQFLDLQVVPFVHAMRLGLSRFFKEETP